MDKVKKNKKITYIDENEGIEEKHYKLKRDLKLCRKEKEEYLTGWQRAKADFINYKANEERIIQENSKRIKESVGLDLLSIMDHIELAEKHMPDNLKDNEWVKGMLHIKKEINGIMRNLGIEKISVSIGERFDPNFHEAVGSMKGGQAKDSIGEVVQSGYKISDKVIRPVKVKIIS